MSDTVIQVDNLGKLYHIGSTADRSKTFREALTDLTLMPFRSLRNFFSPSGSEQKETDYIWALKNVSFEVKQGEVIGIIGRNGAGKSTLLKILSRITEPTEGRVRLRGRVGSLLEVGTGFHTELTGEENIYLSGTILGMSSTEISRKFDEIVAFAEVEKFIHTPVKHYSTGMYLRLAFAVAAHLEPEILLVDEVLAVGDAAFQKKCIGKMGDVAKEGRTVLFVSHNMGAVSELCNGAMVIDLGSIVYRGSVVEAISQYMNLAMDRLGLVQDLREWKKRSGSRKAKILWTDLSWRGQGEKLGCVAIGDDLIIRFEVERDKGIDSSDLRFSIAIRTITGIRVLHITNEDDTFLFPDAIDRGTIVVRLPRAMLYPGIYTVSLWTGSKQYTDYDYVQDCLNFEVVQGNMLPRAFKMDWSQGLVYSPSQWSIEEA